MSQPTTEFDSPWKDVVETYLPELMAFFFADVHCLIDWSRGFEFLDSELRQVVRDAELGTRWVDKLVKVYRLAGGEIWVLIHLEVQSQRETHFAERMFVYHYRLYDRYKRSVASLAILGDESATWRPREFGYELFGCRLNFQFPIVKLLDLGQDWEALANNRNPMATVVMAHLKANQTRQESSERLRWKLALTRRLYEQGYQRQEVIDLFSFIDWVMSLPEGLEEEFWRQVQQLEEVMRMPYLTSVERRGFQQGEAAVILRQLKRRLGQVSSRQQEQIGSLASEQLENLGEALLDFASERDLENWLNQQGSD